MKNEFYGYYPPTPEEYASLWKDAVIILDTNVLLNLYRLPQIAREDILSVLESLSKRIWIPHQVALEFQRGRLTVIGSERKSIEEALTSFKELISQVKSKVEKLQLDKRGLDIQPNPLLSELTTINDKFVEAISKTHEAQLDISASDPVRDQLDKILENRVGPGPETQTEFDNLILNGKERYEHKIPPGFSDSNKEKTDNVYIYDHIKYQKSFGDLILWRQIINKTKSSEIKKILFVTEDRKDDWWWKEQGKRVGPHPELVRELKREGNVEMFWMYSSSNFLEHAEKYLQAEISKDSVAEVELVARANPTEFISNATYINKDVLRKSQFSNWFNLKGDQNASYEDFFKIQHFETWLTENYGNAEKELDYVNYAISSLDGRYGFDVRIIKTYEQLFDESFIPPIIDNGQLFIAAEMLYSYTLVIIIDSFPDQNDAPSILRLTTNNKLKELIQGTYNVTILVGYIFNKRFKAWMEASSV